MFNSVDKSNVFWNSISFIFVAAASFISFTLIIKTYDAETLGLFFVINSIFGLSNTFDFGFGVSAIKHISEFRANKDTINVNKFIVTFLFAFIILAVSILILLTLYFYIFIYNSGLSNKIIGFKTNTIFIFLAIAFISKYLSNYMRNIMEGFAEFKKLSIMNIIVSLLNMITSILLFLFKLEIIYLAVFTMLVNLSASLIFGFYLTFINKEVKLNIKYISLYVLKKYFIYGFNIQAASFVQTFLDPMIKYLLGRFLSLSSVTYFETSKKVIDFTNGLIFSAQKGILNKLSEANAKGVLKEFVNNSLYIYSSMANYYSILIYGILNIFVCFVIMFLFGYKDAVTIYLVLILTYSIINFGGSLYSTFMIHGKGLILLTIQIINFISTFSFLLLSLFFIRGYFGLIGLYLASIINISILFYYLKKYYDFDFLNYIKKTNFYDILLFNLINIINVILLFNSYDNFILIQIIFLFVYIIIFNKYIKYFYNLLKNRVTLVKIGNIIKFK